MTSQTTHSRGLFLTVPVFLLCFVLLSHVQAQAPGLSAEMKHLEFLVGEWKGDGWQLKPDGSRENSFSQKTKVRAKNNSLQIKDERTYRPVVNRQKNSIFLPGTMVFHSSTLEADLGYDEALKAYRWRGKHTDPRKPPIEVRLINDRTLQYGVPFAVEFVPSEGNRKTTIKVNEAGEWNETLEIWHLGRWHLVEESTLKKIK